MAESEGCNPLDKRLCIFLLFLERPLLQQDLLPGVFQLTSGNPVEPKAWQCANGKVLD
jgi:hypothetical protein